MPCGCAPTGPLEKQTPGERGAEQQSVFLLQAITNYNSRRTLNSELAESIPVCRCLTNPPAAFEARAASLRSLHAFKKSIFSKKSDHNGCSLISGTITE